MQAILFSLIFISSPAIAQEAPPTISNSDPVVDAIYSITDEELQVMQHLDALTNGIGPRLSSSQNLTEACHWARDLFERFGLTDSRLEQWGSFPVGFNRRLSKGAMIMPDKLELVFNTNAWTAGTKGLIAGPAILAPTTEDELIAIKGKLNNAWIIASSNRRAPRFNSQGNEIRDRFGKMCDEEGYAGVISPSPKSQLLRTSGNYQINFENLPKRTNISLRRDQFTDIYNRLQEGQKVELEFDIEQSFEEGPIPLYNIIAEIPGGDLANEIIIVGGHIDSWDGAKGAQDNGTGTSTTLEAARILRKTLNDLDLKPRRTIRFMLWSGEEQGLLGSRAYIEQHPEENDLISAVLVHDGGTNACSGIQMTETLRPIFESAFEPIIKHTADQEDEDLRFQLLPVNRLPRGVGSDHDSYLRVGVPGFFWEQRGSTSYGYIHHTQHDTIQEVIPAYQFASTRVIASSAWRLANTENLLPRVEQNNRSRGNRNNRQRLGVSMSENMIVENIVKGGMAEKAKMMVGDQIISIDGKEVNNLEELRQKLRENKNQKEVIWTHNGKKVIGIFDWEKASVKIKD